MTAVALDRLQGGMSKVERYGWTIKDAPGSLMSIGKHELAIDPAYQREVMLLKVKDIASKWSWIACGVIVVGVRNGKFWVIDGQHRVLAARRRSDISELPCIVFETESAKDEANGFLNLNTNRKAMTSIDRLRAMVAAGDPIAVQFSDLCNELGVTLVRTAQAPGTMKSAQWGVRRMAENAETTRMVLSLALEVSNADGIPVQERLLEGLWYIHHNCTNANLATPRLRNRIKERGGKALVDAAHKGATFFERGGPKAWGTGMMNLINKGLQYKFQINSSNDE